MSPRVRRLYRHAMFDKYVLVVQMIVCSLIKGRASDLLNSLIILVEVVVMKAKIY